MVSGVQNVQDITFFPHNNPYTKGGEASIGLAEGPPGTSASRISQVGVGEIYQSDAPTPVAASNRQGDSSVLYMDPAGDTFDTARSKSSGNAVPDLLSVDCYTISGYQVIALTFSFPVAPYTDKRPNSIDVSIWVDNQSGGYAADLSSYQGLGQSGNFSIRYDISLYDGTWFDSAVPNSPGTKIPVSYLGPTVSIMIPTSLLPNPEKAKIVVLAGNMSELTDVAPNAGAISLVAAKSAGQVEKN
jgi:hypothetical protein